MKLRLRTFAGLSLSLLLLLTGCAKMDAAAVIGDSEITLETIQTSITSVLEERKLVDTSSMDLATGDYLTRTQAQFHISVVLLQKIADEYGIDITNTDIELEYQRVVQQVGGEEGLPMALAGASIAKDDFRTYIKTALIYQRLAEALVAQGIPQEQVGSAQQSLIVAKAEELGVVLNPRFGIWDKENATIQPGGDSNGAVENEE
ncbi:MAG: hypothetical protein ACKO29_00595 [Actinomycetota bacterium]